MTRVPVPGPEGIAALARSAAAGAARRAALAADKSVPDACPVCMVPLRDLPEDHSGVLDLRGWRFGMACQGTVSAEVYAELEAMRPF